MKKYDFSGWATKYEKLCSDGRTIMKHAFDDMNGKRVPLVWMHKHDTPFNVIGHADLESRPEGVYAYCSFNDTDAAKHASMSIDNGDLDSLSIYANGLKQQKGSVFHGIIREVSLVLAGANPEAIIDYPVIQHSDDTYGEDMSEVEIWSGELLHKGTEEDNKEDTDSKGEEKVAENKPEKKERTVQDVYNEMSEEQKAVVHYLVGEALAENGQDDEEGEEKEMKHNVFDEELQNEENTLSHDAMVEILSEKSLKKNGTLSDSFMAHAAEYGVDGLEWLFPEDHELNRTPEFIQRDQGWVSVVMNGVHNQPFSRVKTTFADITADEARAKGYLKGRLKKEEVFTLLKRRTEPTTVYKKQKMDRDDIVDITDFDVVNWIKGEMRMMLNEELARAFLIGDGRGAAEEDKIDETKIRPIANDADLFTIKKAVVATEGEDFYKTFIKTAIRARKDYKGSGNPHLFTTEDVLTEMLLLENGIGEPMFKTEQELATKLRVSRIVTVEVMENATIGGKKLLGIIVNLNDYHVGADKGGSISMFEDFDIDYNQEKYLIETRCSGALVKPYSAIVLFENEVPTSVDGGITYSKTVTSMNA